MQVLNIARRAVIIAVLFVTVFSALGGEARAVQPPELPYQTMWTLPTTGYISLTNYHVMRFEPGLYIYSTASTEPLDDMDVLVKKSDMGGNVSWQVITALQESQMAQKIKLDNDGNIYISSSLDVIADYVISKYTNSGALLWSDRINSDVYNSLTDIGTAPNGDLYITGTTIGSFDNPCTFVNKYNLDGELQWSKKMGEEAGELGQGVVACSDNAVYVIASKYWLEGDVETPGLVLRKFHGDGVLLWEKTVGVNSGDGSPTISSDNSENIYLTGFTQYAPGVDVRLISFVIKYGPDGNELWSVLLPSTLGMVGDNVPVTTDASGNVYLAGIADGSSTTGQGMGGSDIFVAKYDSSGAEKWFRLIGTSDDDGMGQLALDASGGLYVSWYNRSTYDSYITKLSPDPYSEITSPADGASISGTDETITGWSMASNGVSFVEVSTDGGASWQTASGTDPWSFLWSLPTNTTSNIISRATDTLGNPQSPSPGITVLVNMPLAIDSVTADPASPKVYGTEITWTTAASGGSGSYLYKYWRKGPDTGGVYVSQRDWDASPDWLWTPGVAQIGSNSIKAIVRNSSGGATVQTVKGFNVTYAPIVIQTFGATPVSPKPSGTSITWDATVTGGSGSYLYKYYRKGPDTGNVYTVARDWDASASWDWTPDAAQVGVSTIKLRVMNATGGGATEAVKGFRVQ